MIEHIVRGRRFLSAGAFSILWGCGHAGSLVSAADDTTGATTSLGGASSAATEGGGGNTASGTLSNGGVATSTSAAGGGSTSVDDGLGSRVATDVCSSSDADCVVRVNRTGDDANDGSSWATAFETVQKGLDAASTLVNEGECPNVEVWVAEGTYTPTNLTDSTDARTVTFQLVANVGLYGGFSGTETQRCDRNIAANITILSGDIGTVGDTADNSYHVVTGATGATLDGFTITGGIVKDADTSPDNTHIGGGMFNDGSSPVVTNCTFTNNSGSGIYNQSCSPTVTNCTFTNNRGPRLEGGGGVFNHDSSPTVTNCTFTGGGMANDGGSPIVTNCAFTGNSAVAWGLAGYGGNQLGGGMHNSTSSPIVTNCTFKNNSADQGGGMYNFESSPIVTNCTFAGNSAKLWGGGMFNLLSSPVVTNCTFVNNKAQGAGAGFGSDVSTPIVTNSIFWNDKAEDGASEMFDNSPVSHSIVQGGYAAGQNIITGDPLFVDAAHGDFHLSAGSPAIDAGNGCANHVTQTDQAGHGRWDIANTPNSVNGLDIGAFEYQGATGVDAFITAFDCN